MFEDICPITQLPIETPAVIEICCHKFEKDALKQWTADQLKEHNDTCAFCPVCRTPYLAKHIICNKNRDCCDVGCRMS